MRADGFSWAFWIVPVSLLLQQRATTGAAEGCRSRHSRNSRSHGSQSSPAEYNNNFCSKDDHLIITVAADGAASSQLHILSFRNRLGELDFIPYNVSAKDAKVTRRELFRFQNYRHDHDYDQWAIVSADGSYHLAVNETGGLVMKGGCISTTFLRVVNRSHLEDCFEGVRCILSLCATNLNATNFDGDNAFVVSPRDQTRALRVSRHECKSYKSFQRRRLPTTIESWHELRLLSASAHTHMLKRGLRRLCSQTFGGEPKQEYCPSQTEPPSQTTPM